jgi:hypothetical protein
MCPSINSHTVKGAIKTNSERNISLDVTLYTLSGMYRRFGWYVVSILRVEKVERTVREINTMSFYARKYRIWGLCLNECTECLEIIKNSMAWVRERTTPTERPLLVGKVSANFFGWSVSRGERDGSLRPYCRFSRPELLLFLPSSSSIVLTRMSGPRYRPTTCQKIWLRRESNPDL